MQQKFQAGDKVKILLGAPSWSNTQGHHDSRPEWVGKEAIVLGSYKDMYGTDNIEDFSIQILPERYSVSWFTEDQLELVERAEDKTLDEIIQEVYSYTQDPVRFTKEKEMELREMIISYKLKKP